MQNSALVERTMDDHILDAAPFLDVFAARDEHIGRNPKRSQDTAQTHHLRMAIFNLGLDHDEIKVAVGPGIATGMRPKQDHR